MSDFYKLCTIFANALKSLGYKIYGDNILDYISPHENKSVDFLTGYIKCIRTTIVDINNAQWPEYIDDVYINIVFFTS